MQLNVKQLATVLTKQFSISCRHLLLYVYIIIFFWQVVAPHRSLFHFDMQPHVSENVSSSISLASVWFFFFFFGCWTFLTFMMTGGHVGALQRESSGELRAGAMGAAGAVTTDVDTCYIIIAGDSFAFLLSCRFAGARTKHKSNCTALCWNSCKRKRAPKHRRTTQDPHTARWPAPATPSASFRCDGMQKKGGKGEREERRPACNNAQIQTGLQSVKIAASRLVCVCVWVCERDCVW